MKTSELQGAQLDYWVARAEGWAFKPAPISNKLIYATTERPEEWRWLDMFNPSTDWAFGGPIIEKERIALFHADGEWGTEVRPHGETWIDTTIYDCIAKGSTPLIAAMRAYVTSKFGNEVPDA